MERIENIGKEKVRELILKNWMTHDAMWFFHCLTQFGIDKTNQINRAAVRSMAQIEIKRIKKILGVDKITTFEQFKEFVPKAYDLIRADFMKFTFSFPKENQLKAEFLPGECFAYKGVTKLGMIDQYHCGIFDRIEGWFDALGLKYEVTPKVTVCMMHTEGFCFREYRFTFG